MIVAFWCDRRSVGDQRRPVGGLRADISGFFFSVGELGGGSVGESGGAWFTVRVMAEHDYVLARLDDDWLEIVASDVHREEFESWRCRFRCLGRVDDLGSLVERVDDGELGESSELVWALLDLVDESDLARRVLLQVIVPGLGGELAWLNSWARRVDPGLLPGGDIDQMLILSALDAIDHAAGHRRPWPICSILRRSHRVLVRQLSASERWHDRVELASLMEEAVPSGDQVEMRPEVALLDLFGRASQAGVLSECDARLLWLMGVDGYSSDELAGSFGIAPRSVATRRLRAERRLRQMVLAE